MKLANKTALIFAANGAVGTAVAKEFAAQGATVFLSGRNLPDIQKIADEINRNGGGQAHARQVDATCEAAILEYVRSIYEQTGKIDIAFNAIGIRAAEGDFGKPVAALDYESFLTPIVKNVGSRFLTAKAVAPYMIEAKSGVIVMFSASLAVQAEPGLAGISASYGAIEAMTRVLAAELGVFNVRVNCVRAGAMVETRQIKETIVSISENAGIPPEAISGMMEQRTLLKRTPRVEEAARVVTFLASDEAGAMTGQIVNVSTGMILH